MDISYKGFRLLIEYPEFSLKNWIANKIQLFKKAIQKLFPRKLYRYGHFGLTYFDDRTKRDKFNDWINDVFIDPPKDYRPKHGIANLYRWMTFFDTSNGVVIDSMDKVKDYERQGQYMMSHSEAQREFKRKKLQREQAYHNKSKKLMEEKFIKLNQGYSYRKQFANRERIEALREHLQ